jgi:acyl carrier protein
LNVRDEVVRVLDTALGLDGRAAAFSDATPLMGNLPALDSMAVVTIIGNLEERFGISIEDDDIDGSTFATLGSLVAFVSNKLQG